MSSAPFPDVYSARDIAAAAGVSDAVVQRLLDRGEIRSLEALMPTGAPETLAGFVGEAEAIRAVRALATGSTVAVPDGLGLGRELFSERRPGGRGSAVPFIVSTSLHGLAVGTVLFIASLGFAVADARTEPLVPPEQMRLVFLVQPGPGGGGGGGGLKMRTPPPKAEREGIRKISSPLPARELPPPMRPTPRPPEPPPKPLEAKQLPPVMAPIVTAPADTKNVEGVLAKAPELPPSQGSGTGGGVGSGKGTGIGEGDGFWSRTWVRRRHWRRAVSARQRCRASAPAARGEGRLLR